MIYSNCLLEALKAKIKDPRNVHIFCLPKEVNGGKLHFMWKKGDKIYHAHKEIRDNNENNKRFLFNTSLKEVSESIFKKWLLCNLAGSPLIETYKDTFDLPLKSLKAVQSYEYFSNDKRQIILYQEDYEWPESSYVEVKKFLKKEPQIKVIYLDSNQICITTFKDLKKMSGTFKSDTCISHNAFSSKVS